VLAAAHEREQIAPLLAAIPPQRCITVLGASLGLAAACLERAECYIGNDSGLMHLAAAVGTPTLGLFGPGTEQVYGPWGVHTACLRTPESAAELLKRLPHPGAHQARATGRPGGHGRRRRGPDGALRPPRSAFNRRSVTRPCRGA
jgi:ADP-heptose:LPS heptosyltransferase